MILEKVGRRTLNVHDIATAASFILRDGKDAHSCTTMLELNIRAYANYDAVDSRSVAGPLSFPAPRAPLP